ncbi:hypothetical protein AB9N12_14905 [Bacteroides sp. AN502(2024)]|uniref:hypothetical protein n=1 Tax=Bacteroides sp. AN502(2024) TaxID=3160599 RepID=UPI0035124F23
MKKPIVTCFLGSLFLLFVSSCTDDSELSNDLPTPLRSTSSFLAFSNKEELKGIIENGQPLTRSVNAEFISLMDVVNEDDSILSQFSIEERNYIKENALSYYDVLEYEDIVPNENFARLLNSKGEIQVNDSVYRITHFGTLCTNLRNVGELEVAYRQLQEDAVKFTVDSHVIPITPNVNLINSYDSASGYEESGESDNNDISVMTRTVTEAIPYHTFPHFSSESHTAVGKVLGKIFGDRSVKHHNFMKGFRVKGSLYDYDYGVYSEVGTYVAMRKKRGGFLRKLNGWKGVRAEELSITYRGIVLEMKTKLPNTLQIPKKPTLLRENVRLTMNGIGKQLFCLDICGLEFTDKDIMKFAGMGLKAAIPELKKLLGVSVSNKTQAIRILTQSKVYVVIFDNQVNEYNTEQVRKVFSSGVKFYVSSDIIKNPFSLKSAIDFMNGLRELPVKRMVAGEVILAGKINNRWGGMIIKKK